VNNREHPSATAISSTALQLHISRFLSFSRLATIDGDNTCFSLPQASTIKLVEFWKEEGISRTVPCHNFSRLINDSFRSFNLGNTSWNKMLCLISDFFYLKRNEMIIWSLIMHRQARITKNILQKTVGPWPGCVLDALAKATDVL